jgi:hypothetical protein
MPDKRFSPTCAAVGFGPGKSCHLRGIGKSPRLSGKKTMKLDLKKDAEKIRRYISKRVSNYPIYENLGPGDDTDPIRLITLGYYTEQTGYFAFVIDTRADADGDGEWTQYIEEDVNVLAFPKWCAACEKLCHDGAVEVTLPNGTQKTLDESDDTESIAKLFGEMILELMLSLRDSGVFDGLPLASKAYFDIEEFDGNWGWPTNAKQKAQSRLKLKKPV